jgi:hypothetical protein
MSSHIHKITEVDEGRKVGICAGCGPDSPVVWRHSNGRSYWICRRGPSWLGGQATPESRRAYAIPSKYGISVAEYDALLAKQGGICAICSRTCSTGRRLSVDHEHDSGRIRGLLCNSCNRAIGLFGDDPARLHAAIAYLS